MPLRTLILIVLATTVTNTTDTWSDIFKRIYHEL